MVDLSPRAIRTGHGYPAGKPPAEFSLAADSRIVKANEHLLPRGSFFRIRHHARGRYRPGTDARRVHAGTQKEAVDSAPLALQIFTNRYTGGVDTYLQVITAQTTALSNERNDADILRRRMDASVLLIKALGGGWNAANLPKL
jgi:hypothetical protein